MYDTKQQGSGYNVDVHTYTHTHTSTGTTMHTHAHLHTQNVLNCFLEAIVFVLEHLCTKMNSISLAAYVTKFPHELHIGVFTAETDLDTVTTLQRTVFWNNFNRHMQPFKNV